MSEPRFAVLLVEDDENLQEVLRTLLLRHSTSIDVASDGERAIEMLHQNKYDVVVLDLMLPKKNGLIVADEVASLPHTPRLIVLSVISRYFHDRFPAGTLVLQKPLDIDNLADAVRSVRAELQGRSPAAPSRAVQ